MRERLRVVLRPSERLEPLRRAAVALRPSRPRDLTVRDVPEQEVAERVLGLAGDRGAAGPLDELLPLEPVQALLHETPGSSVAVGERACPEHLAVNGCVLEQRFLVRGERVEARRDDSLHGLGERQPLRFTPLGQHADVLLRVERVALRTREELRLRSRVEHGLVEERRHEPGGVGVRERRERDRVRVELAAAPARTPLEQLRTGGAQDEQRHAARPVDEVVDEIEQALVRPVQILEHEHGRLRVGEGLEQLTPR